VATSTKERVKMIRLCARGVYVCACLGRVRITSTKENTHTLTITAARQEINLKSLHGQ
jgi:hypothetical protein